ncbi:collagen alpha-1(I) chain-like [Sciurus carolinensis]|uniref:collagen alpha-1(I) chain-like n=1 Tax=Sciurus carolinensis TaxID=30640 RepID=UPI001FB476F8|nr:collagen alpha-1(I) chain-like [Sciurus carolinensis]
MNEGEQGGRGPEGGLTPPFIFRFTWVRGRREGEPGRGGRGEKSEKCPPSLANSEATSAPSSRRGGGRCKALPVTLHEGRAERESPCPRHPRRRCRRRAPSSVSLKPPLPARPAPLGPPPAPRGSFQTPWARGGCSGRKRWPRLGPGRRGCERGGGGAPSTVSPATRRWRAHRDAGSSRSTAGARRRQWQREPRDRSITGSHGARAFSSLRAGASARHSSSGRKGPAPEPPRRAAGRARERTVRASLVLFSAAGSSPRCSRGRAGGGRGWRRRLLSRRRWWPDGLVQRLQPTPFKGTRDG